MTNQTIYADQGELIAKYQAWLAATDFPAHIDASGDAEDLQCELQEQDGQCDECGTLGIGSCQSCGRGACSTLYQNELEWLESFIDQWSGTLTGRTVLNLAETQASGFAANFEYDECAPIGSIMYQTNNGSSVFIGILDNGQYTTVVEREDITSHNLAEVEAWLAARATWCD